MSSYLLSTASHVAFCASYEDGTSASRELHWAYNVYPGYEPWLQKAAEWQVWNTQQWCNHLIRQKDGTIWSCTAYITAITRGLSEPRNLFQFCSFSVAVDKNVNKLLHLESMTPALPWVTSTIPKAFSLCFSLVHITSPASGTASTHHIVLEVSRNEAGLFPHIVLEGYRYCPCFCGQHSSVYIQWKLSFRWSRWCGQSGLLPCNSWVV